MAKIKGGCEHVMVSTSSVISTTACTYYGCIVVNATTAGVRVKVFDSTATALGNLVDTVIIAAGTLANASRFFTPNGVIMHSGIYLSAVVCTTASDNVIVFYGGL